MRNPLSQGLSCCACAPRKLNVLNEPEIENELQLQLTIKHSLRQSNTLGGDQKDLKTLEAFSPAED